jgi:hypothetical protein
LKNGEHVSARVLEPGDVWALRSEDALAVLLDAVVALESHATRDQVIDDVIDVVHFEVEDRVAGGRHLRLVVDEGVSLAGEVQLHEAVLLGGPQSERPGVEVPSLVHVVYDRGMPWWLRA